MANDAAILVAGFGSAPLDYTVPNAQEIEVLLARAVVDGSGAGAAFLPVLQLVSDAGLILAEAITDTTVAAGGSAQVSWFPHVGAAGVSTPTLLAGLKFAYTTMISTTVNAGAGKVVPLDPSLFVTNDASVWSQSGFNDVVFNAVGHYLCGISWRITAPGLFATTFPGEMGVNKQPGLPTTFGYDTQFNVASTATGQMQEYQWQIFTIDGAGNPTGLPLEYRFVNHTAVVLTLEAAVLMIQLDTSTTGLS